MSIYIGIDKKAKDQDEVQIHHIVRMLINNGYIREPVEISPDLTFLKFDKGTVEIKPAYEIDKLF